MRGMDLCALGIMLLGITLQSCSTSLAGANENRQLYCICDDRLVPLLDEECEISGLDPKNYMTSKSSFDELCKKAYDPSCRATTEDELKRKASRQP